MKTWDQIARRLLWVAAAVLKQELRPAPPAKLAFLQVQVQDRMGVQIKYTAEKIEANEALSKADLTLTVNDVGQPTSNPPVDAPFVFGQFDVGAKVAYTLVVYDLAENPSTPATGEFTVTDTVAPVVEGLAFNVEQVEV